jgi:hypothetical protein
MKKRVMLACGTTAGFLLATSPVPAEYIRLMFHSFDVNGLLTATMDITMELKLAKDGDTFMGVSRFVRTDLSGNVLNFCATMDGQRFTL